MIRELLHRYWPRDRFEVAIYVLIGVATLYYVWSYNWAWQAWLMAPLMIAMGLLTVELLYDQWFPPGR